MENPIKAALNVSLILKTALVVFIIFAVAEATGFQSWLLSPISSWKNRNATS
jgi:hypothetical protein